MAGSGDALVKEDTVLEAASLKCMVDVQPRRLPNPLCPWCRLNRGDGYVEFGMPLHRNSVLQDFLASGLPEIDLLESALLAENVQDGLLQILQKCWVHGVVANDFEVRRAILIVGIENV